MKHSELRHQPRHVNPRIQVRRNYPKALLEPISVEPDKLCEKMGLTIKRSRISEDGNGVGRVYCYDGTIDVFDDDT